MGAITFSFGADGKAIGPLEQLAQDLNAAIEREDYAEAARIRDEIERLKHEYRSIREPFELKPKQPIQ